MSTHSDGPQKPVTAQELDAWLLTAKKKRLVLHVQATGPWNSLSRQEAFMEMSCLLEEAFDVAILSRTHGDTELTQQTRCVR